MEKNKKNKRSPQGKSGVRKTTYTTRASSFCRYAFLVKPRKFFYKNHKKFYCSDKFFLQKP